MPPSPQPLRPTAFLDRDGVLNVDLGYVGRVQDLEWISGAPQAVRRLNDLGYLVIVVTNQSGIGRGYYGHEDMEAVHRALSDGLAEVGARINAFYASPYHPEAVIEQYRHPDHPDRKPNPGLILRAMQDWPVDAARSFLIGDKDSDIEAARRAGIEGRLFEGGNLDVFVQTIVQGRP